MNHHRESIAELANPLALEGVEFIEYATTRPQAFGQVLEQMGFAPIARHRSREVLLYRQGDINVIINAHDALGDTPEIIAVAFRVRDAAAAYARVVDRGGWAVPVQVEVMELNIPAIHGAGSSRIYFVDRYREFSIYDVDFVPLVQSAKRERAPAPAVGGMHLFGIVQYIAAARSKDWVAFYVELFGFEALQDGLQFGILPKGHILRSPCGTFFWQLIEPSADADVLDVVEHERLERVAFGTRDVVATAAVLRANGIEFLESGELHVENRGAITRSVLGSVMFELVHDERA
jgi:4-hydroxyphenylpyruvate dioxygenase